MQDPLDYLLDGEHLTPEQRAAWRAALAQDEDLRESLEQWQEVCAALRSRLDTVLPDRHDFVLHVLAGAGHADGLSEEERQQVAASWAAMERAMEAYPALRDAARRIEEDRAVFDACWEQPVRVVRLTPRTWRMAAVAAVAVLIGFAAVFGLLPGGSDQTVAVSGGETRSLELPDGSTVLLMDDAAVRYSEEDFARHVAFNGSAFFDVAHADVPFTIQTPDGIATVLGTRFGVKAAGNVTEVILESGRVSLASRKSPGQPVTLRPGEMSSVMRGGLPSAPTPVNLMHALEWTGYLFFDATPMAEVARVLENRYQVEVILDAALQQEAVSGSFEPDDAPAHILNVLATVLDASVTGSAESGFTVRPASSL